MRSPTLCRTLNEIIVTATVSVTAAVARALKKERVRNVIAGSTGRVAAAAQASTSL